MDLTSVDTLITPESGLLSKPADIAAADDGALFVLDYGRPSILQLDTTDRLVVREFGRLGAGPGELRSPLGLALWGDTIITTNVGNGRFEAFSRAGEILPSRPAPAGARYGRLALNADGGFILPTNGEDGILARLFSPDGTAAFGVGTPVVPLVPAFDLGAYRAAALRDEVPDYFRNGVLAVLAPDSVVWLAFNTEPLVERFASRGGLLGRTAIADPAFTGIRGRYVERNRQDSTGRRVYPLLYFADLKAEGRRLWVLLNMPPSEPAVVIRLGPSGAIERRFRIPGVSDVWRIAVRAATHDLLFASAETASLFRVHLTPEQWNGRGTAP